jgi:uncharacterized protein (TIGR03435 family)
MANHLWQSTLFVVLAAILVLALRKNQGRVRYWVWLTASVKFLIPFSLLIALGSYFAKPRASTPTQAVVYSAVEDFSQPFAEQVPPVISQAAPASVSLMHLLPPVIVAVWLAGIVVVLLVWATGWIRVSLMVRRAAPLREGPEVEALRRLESGFGVRKPIRLVLSRNWMEPGIFGVFRPVLIWPEGISQHLDDKHIDAILAHEICHARRHDNLTAILHMLVETVFWFHPLVWWMGARLEEERERACDEEVSLLCNQPHVYAESILRVCKFCSESPLACVSGITGADLKRRIVQIMTERVVRKLDVGRKLLLLVVGLAVLAAPIVLGQAQAARKMMLAAVAAAPKPMRAWAAAAADAMTTEEQTPSTSLLAEDAGSAKFLKFDVASVKQHPPGGNGVGSEYRPDGYSCSNLSLLNLIVNAYGIKQYLISGGPSWIDSIGFDVEAKVDDSDVGAFKKLPPEQRDDLLRYLIVDRFKLKVHSETKILPMYDLVVAKGGSKLKLSAPIKESVDAGKNDPRATTPHSSEEYGRGMFKGRRVSTKAVADRLSYTLHSTVVDKTGLSGLYDVNLKWSPEDASPTNENAPAGSSPSIFTAVQEQLGLRLGRSKGPVETLVIDHAEKPSVDGAEVPAQASPNTAGLAVGAPSQSTASAASVVSSPAASITQPLKFTTASVAIKMSGKGSCRTFGVDPTPDGLSVSCLSVKQMIENAYGLEEDTSDSLVPGGPAWAVSTNFDVEAKLDGATADALNRLPEEQQRVQRRYLLQSILTQHFHLQARRETRQIPIYAVVIGEGGLKLKPTDPNQPDTHGMTHNGAPAAAGSSGITVGSFYGHAVPISALASALNQTQYSQLDRMVIDKTGLGSKFDIHLSWAWTPRKAGDAPAVPGPPIFTTVQEQLGLKLEPTESPMEFVAIDHLEKPTEN